MNLSNYLKAGIGKILAVGMIVTLALGATAQGDSSRREGRSQPIRNSAEDYMFRTLNWRSRWNVVALVRDFNDDREFLTQVRIDRQGRESKTILQPLSMQGVVNVDDGKNFKVFDPDRKEIIIGRSHRNSNDNRTRMWLIGQNYDLSLQDSPQIAGRSTVCVLAAPKHTKALSSRKYYIDKETAFLLRIEKLSQSGRAKLVKDTTSIDFNAKLGDGDFELKPIGEPRTIVRTAPTRLSTKADGMAELGIRLVIPSAPIPYGFRVQKIEVRSWQNVPRAALHLTDGIVNVSMYQYRGERPRGGNMDNVAVVDSTVLLLFGDLPRSIESALLKSFVDRAAEIRTATPAVIKPKLWEPPSMAIPTEIPIFHRAPSAGMELGKPSIRFVR